MMELNLKDEQTKLHREGDNEPRGLRVYYEKTPNDDLEDGEDYFYLCLNELYVDEDNKHELTFHNIGVKLSRDSAIALHGFLGAIIKL